MDKLQFIEQTLKKAGEILLEERKKDYSMAIKNGDIRDIITGVDLILNKYLTEQIQAQFEGDKIHSEETENTLSLEDSFWCIDPIDGTSNFANNIPHFAICLSYFSKGKVVCGGALNPVTNEFFAVDENAAYLDGEKVSVSDVSDLARSVVAMNAGRSSELRIWSAELYTKLLGNTKSVRNLASSALDFCFVGAGRVDACIYAQLTVFDIVFALEFIKKAGGIVTNEKFEELELSFDKQKVFAFANQEILEQIKALGI